MVSNPNNNQTNGEVVLNIEHLSKSFGSKHVLKDVNLKLHKGENLVVLGKSGQGKSVLIKCIVGLIIPDSGKLEVLGQNIPDLKYNQLNQIRKQIGFLFQSAALYDSMSVKENLAFPLRHADKELRNKTDELIVEALANVNLSEAIDKMPAELSGGMRKRLGLARTLILNPAIMLYDEPTTGLDPITSKEISELILTTQQKYQTSSIIITHDMECARITANRVIVLKDGEFIAEGTYEELQHAEDEFIRSFFE